jgi:hypothetical protein
MKTFKKNWIGKGKQVAGLDIVKVTCKLEDLRNFAYTFDGVEYVTFEVAKMKNPDSYGRDHTVYVSTQEEVETPEAPKQDEKSSKKPKKSKKATAETGSEDDLPF